MAAPLLQERLLDDVGDLHDAGADDELGGRPAARALPDGSNGKRVVGESGFAELSAVWDQITMCSAVGLVAGLWSAFGIYASTLKANGGFNATGAATLGIVLNLGSFLSGPFVGEVHDRIGPKRSCAVAALLGGLGYSMVAGAVAQPAGSATNSVAFLSPAFFMVGVSSPLAYVGAMYTATTILSVRMRPIAVLVVGVPNQLGGILAALVFHYGSERFDEFFITLAVITAAVYGLATVVLRTAPLGVAAANRPDVADRGVALPLPDSTAVPRPDSTDSAVIAGSTGSASERKARSLLARPLWLQHFIDVLRHPDFWYLTGPSSVVIGAALSISNSLSLVVETITDTQDNEYRKVSFNLVMLFISAAVLCRLIMLWAVYRLHYAYGTYITVCCGLGALGALVLAVGPTVLAAVYTGVALIGMSFGGIWPISTTILRSIFPGSRFGMALGVFGMFPGVTGLVFGYVASGLYDRHADGPQHLCVGDKCYRGVFLVACAAAVVATLLSIPLIRRTPKTATK